MGGQRPRPRLAPLAAAVAVALVAVAACGSPATRAAPDPAPTTTSTTLADPPPDLAATTSQLGPWHLSGHEPAFAPAADEGVTTVGRQVVYRGDLDLTSADQAQGWVHIGDPDSYGGSVVDAYQGPPGATQKMFRVTAPGGATRDYVHPLAPGELVNNSFAAISPDGRWLVSGEWGLEQRLLVLPSPTASGAPDPLPLAPNIALDRPAYDVQGCDFVTATRLLCVSDDPGTSVWPTPFPLLQVDLPHPLDGRSVTGRVTDLGGLPTVSRCQGTFEPEGIDYDATTGVLRVEVTPPAPCSTVTTTVYDYTT
jgi:hypothetical protein